MTLYAKWTALPTYAVIYNANDATGGTAPPSQTKIHSENLTLAGNSGNLTKTGYTFAGWNTDPDGTGTDYAEGAVYTLNVQLVLFAKWELNGTSFWNLVLPAILNNSRETR